MGGGMDDQKDGDSPMKDATSNPYGEWLCCGRAVLCREGRRQKRPHSRTRTTERTDGGRKETAGRRRKGAGGTTTARSGSTETQRGWKCTV